MSKKSVISPNCFCPFIFQPRNKPSQLTLLKFPCGCRSAPRPCPQHPGAWGCVGGSCPSLLPAAAAAGPCHAIMRMKPLSRRERGWQRGAGGAWMLSRHLPLGGERRQRCLSILPPAPALPRR